ncbi:MAG TPA: type II secretion system F family protein [Mycobacteriales bacterium]|jgi:tight adherence protein C|nr:type II secretion system F family protein [Mycobacteriales bacterium]
MLALVALLLGGGIFCLSVGVLRSAGAGGAATPSVLFLRDEAEGEVDEFRARLRAPLSERLATGVGAQLADAMKRLTPSSIRSELDRRLLLAGLEGRLDPTLVYLGKAVFAGVFGLVFAALPSVAGLPSVFALPGLVLGVLFGFMAPDLLLSTRADARQATIRRALPEALDLMAISVQAGVGLEQAVSIVTERLPGALGEELARFLHEVRLGVSRREALVSLRERTSCPELSTFVLSLLQADALGIAIGEVLKTQAAEIRAKRRQLARERAAKAPVRLLFPLIFGILPALFVVILGPAGIQISGAFSGR